MERRFWKARRFFFNNLRKLVAQEWLAKTSKPHGKSMQLAHEFGLGLCTVELRAFFTFINVFYPALV